MVAASPAVRVNDTVKQNSGRFFAPVTRKPSSQVQAQPEIVRPSLAAPAKKEAKVLSQAGTSSWLQNGAAAKKEARVISDGSRRLVLGHGNAKAAVIGQREAAPRKIANNTVTSTAVYGKSLANPTVQTLRTVAKEEVTMAKLESTPLDTADSMPVTSVAACIDPATVNGQVQIVQNVIIENGTTNGLKEISRKVEDDMLAKNAATLLTTTQAAEKAVSEKVSATTVSQKGSDMVIEKVEIVPPTQSIAKAGRLASCVQGCMPWCYQ
jgi:hypothetical protein